MTLDVDLNVDKQASHVSPSLSITLKIELDRMRLGLFLFLCAGCVFAAIWKIIVFVVINYA